MTHELKSIIGAYLVNRSKGLKSVLATVVKLEGSSYRKPGVRMLVAENGEMTGAVSGGCVEKEIYRRSLEVFENDSPLLITYDGSYRLGCEGILYILIELFAPAEDFIYCFEKLVKNRLPISLTTFFPDNLSFSSNAGSFIKSVENQWVSFRENNNMNLAASSQLSRFDQLLKSAFRLVIIGAEHDAVQLANFAGQTGWEVFIVASARDPKVQKDFPAADKIFNTEPADFDFSVIDEQTAVVLMSHSYTKDMAYLLKLIDTESAYIGLLGPKKRREKLLTALIESNPEVSDDFLKCIHGPAGLNIGAETPQEIALSIMSEILSIVRKTEPGSLRSVKGSIHETQKFE